MTVEMEVRSQLLLLVRAIIYRADNGKQQCCLLAFAVCLTVPVVYTKRGGIGEAMRNLWRHVGSVSNHEKTQGIGR